MSLSSDCPGKGDAELMVARKSEKWEGRCWEVGKGSRGQESGMKVWWDVYG